MNRAKEHVIVVLINFKELVEVNKLKREAKNRYENNIISSNINLNPENSGPLVSQTWAVILIEFSPLNINSSIISDDLQKAENLNCYFAAQMTIYENSYELPTLPRLTYLTDDRLDIVTAKEFDVLKYLCKANPNKSSVPDAIIFLNVVTTIYINHSPNCLATHYGWV